ncbi:putative B3 domain-containing protein At2g27410 [Rosa chinensis]|nr:putative B3 domain-containing protein At2g27410 [Rosa chinensis]XP_040373260.1 putative B3 domain-containing protein At2g27410 [Rosa chinensis]
MGISLEDLKRREYSESFDELLAKAKEFATDREEALEILRNWILYDLSCRKSTREEKKSTNIDPKEKAENRRDRCKIVIKKMKASSTKPCNDIRKDLVPCNDEDEEASHPSSSRNNDQQMKRKHSPYACCSKISEDQDKCFNKLKEASSPHSSTRKKRKSQSIEDQHACYYTVYNYAGKAGNLMNLMETQKKVKKPRALPFDGPPPELPMDLRNKIESLHGSEPKLVIQKEITNTDVNRHHDRLNMPRNQVLTMDVLNEQERKKVFEHGLEVRVIQPCLEERNLQLRKWNSHNGGYSYVLNSGWKDVVSKCEDRIRPGNTIQVWSFRVDDRGEVCFALVCHGPTKL